MSERKQPNFTREIRINPVVPSESVLVSTERGLRPRKKEAPAPRDTRAHVESCPFCTGNEDQTPATLYSVPADSKEWNIRVIENLFPLLGDDRANDGLNLGMHQIIDGYGRHEVIIDHNQHGITVPEMSNQHLADLLGVYRDRSAQLYAADERLRYVQVFKNFGPAAGASMQHTHSQLVAMPVVPENVYKEVLNSREYYRKNNKCIFCALIDEALTFETTVYDRDSGEVRRKIDVGQYVIERGERFVAIKPFASRYDWEVHILPLKHMSDYQDCEDDDLADMARVLRRTMARLEQVIGGAQYNYFLHSRPHGPDYEDCRNSYHWQLEICPRTSIPNGFELGSGLAVSTISPEDAAMKLRSVVLPDDENTATKPQG